MSPETKGRLFDPAAAIDRLRGIGDVTHRALKYCSRSVKHAVIGAIAGAMLVGYAFLSERTNQAIPDTDRQYSRETISAGNKVATDNPIPVIAGGAVLGVIFGGAAPWINRKLEEFCLESERPK